MRAPGHKSRKNVEPGLDTRFLVLRPQKGDQSWLGPCESEGDFRSMTLKSMGKRKETPHPKPSESRCRKH